MEFSRHGDLVFKKINQIPKSKLINEVESFTLAEGEQTGHHHTITVDKPETKMRIYQLEDGQYVMEIKEGTATLTHQEHKPIVFTPGIYIQQIEQEYDYYLEETQKVVD